MDNGGDQLNLQEVKAFGSVTGNTPVQQLATYKSHMLNRDQRVSDIKENQVFYMNLCGLV